MADQNRGYDRDNNDYAAKVHHGGGLSAGLMKGVNTAEGASLGLPSEFNRQRISYIALALGYTGIESQFAGFFHAGILQETNNKDIT